MGTYQEVPGPNKNVPLQCDVHFLCTKCMNPLHMFSLYVYAKGSQAILFLITTPVYILLLVSRLTQEKMNLPDIVFHRVLLVLIFIEFFADQQQWSKLLFIPLFPFSHDIRFLQPIPQTSNKRSASTYAPPNYPPTVNIPPKSSTEALSSPASGHGRATQTSPPNKQFGFSSTNGRATGPLPTSTGLLWARDAIWPCSRAARG